VRSVGSGAVLGAAIIGLLLSSGATAEAPLASATGARAQAPPPGQPATLEGKYRTTLRVKSGGKPFGQKPGSTVTRTWSIEERCGKVSPCDVVKLTRKGKTGRFGSKLRRQGQASWSGVEKVRGRCGDGLGFTSKARIELQAVEYRGRDVAEFTGTFKARVKGCVKGGERATLRGRLR